MKVVPYFIMKKIYYLEMIKNIFGLCLTLKKCLIKLVSLFFKVLILNVDNILKELIGLGDISI